MYFVNPYSRLWKGNFLIMELCDVCLVQNSEYDNWAQVGVSGMNSTCAICGARQIRFECSRDRARHLVEVLFPDR